MGFMWPNNDVMQWLGSRPPNAPQPPPSICHLPTATSSTAPRPPPQIRESYIALDYWPSEEKLRALLSRAAACMATLTRNLEARAALRRRVQLKQRSQLFNKLHRQRRKLQKKLMWRRRAAEAAGKLGGSWGEAGRKVGQGWPMTKAQREAARRGREVEPTWHQRKMKPPGKMGRRF